jgi:type IX secretion system PorP/SprF family membrane protein
MIFKTMKKNNLFILMACLMSVLSQKALAQHDPVYGQYVFNSSIINPAQAGATRLNQFGVLHRNQWVNIDGAPVTKSIFVNTRLRESLGISIGAYQDEIGPINDVNLQADIAYHARINEKWILSGGLRTMGAKITANFTDLIGINPADPLFSSNFSSGYYLNMGMGMLLYSERTFYGVSIPKAFTREYGGSDQISNIKLRQNLFLYAGTMIALSDQVTVRPSTLLRVTQGTIPQLDLNLTFSFLNLIDIGPMLRSFDAAGVAVGITFNEKWYMGYMYEYPLTDIQIVTRQTHELSLRYLWQSKFKSRILSPRYFI